MKYKQIKSESRMKRIAKIILIVLVIIGIIAFVSLAVKDKFSKSSSNSVTGKVVFSINGFVTGGDGFKCACDDNSEEVQKCSEAYPEQPYCVSGECSECREDSDCSNNNKCVDNWCESGCRDNSGCNSDEYCDTWSNGIPGTCMPYCGDGECNNGETEETCSQDCGSTCNSCSGCSPTPDWCGYCGDGECNNGETEETCSQDCGTDPSCSNGGIPSCDPLCGGLGCGGCDPSDCTCLGTCGDNGNYAGCTECWCDSMYCIYSDLCDMGYEEYC